MPVNPRRIVARQERITNRATQIYNREKSTIWLFIGILTGMALSKL